MAACYFTSYVSLIEEKKKPLTAFLWEQFLGIFLTNMGSRQYVHFSPSAAHATQPVLTTPILEPTCESSEQTVFILLCGGEEKAKEDAGEELLILHCESYCPG